MAILELTMGPATPASATKLSVISYELGGGPAQRGGLPSGRGSELDRVTLDLAAAVTGPA